MTRKQKDRLAVIVENMGGQYGLSPDEVVEALRFSVVWTEIHEQVLFLREQTEADAIGAQHETR